mmetsp:Transcript_12315/g.16206  ORF Transcript_12315/g.16206 Transcript_12315/m.16206 type:complete len:109 (-) Transcript_12315:151-477(-)
MKQAKKSIDTLASKSCTSFIEHAVDMFANCGYTLNQVEMEFQEERQPPSSIPSSPSVVKEVLNRITFNRLDEVELFRQVYVEEKESFDSLKQALANEKRPDRRAQRHA